MINEVRRGLEKVEKFSSIAGSLNANASKILRVISRMYYTKSFQGQNERVALKNRQSFCSVKLLKWLQYNISRPKALWLIKLLLFFYVVLSRIICTLAFNSSSRAI